METYAQKLLYKKHRSSFEEPGIPRGVIDPLIANDVDGLDKEGGVQLMFWHLRDVWRWLIKFDSALSRCNTLTSREKEMCFARFERARTTDPLASVYASKFMTYLLVNKWSIVGSDDPEVMIGLVQVLILIVSNMAFKDSSFKKLAKIGIPIKRFPFYASLLVIKEADPGYGFLIDALRKSKSTVPKFIFNKEANKTLQTIADGWANQVAKAPKDKNTSGVENQFQTIAKIAKNEDWSISKDKVIIDPTEAVIDLLKNSKFVDDFHRNDDDTADTIKTLQNFVSNGVTIAVTTAPAITITVTGPALLALAPVQDAYKRVFSQITGFEYIKFTSGSLEAVIPDPDKLPETQTLYLTKGANLLSPVTITIPGEGTVDTITKFSTSWAVVADRTTNNLKLNYEWTYHMDLFTQTLITHFEPTALRQLLGEDAVSGINFDKLIKLMVLSDVQSRGIPKLKKLITLQKELNAEYEEDEDTRRNYIKETQRQAKGDFGFGRRGGSGGRKKRSYGKRKGSSGRRKGSSGRRGRR